MIRFLPVLSVFLSPPALIIAQDKPAEGEKRTLEFHRLEKSGTKYSLSSTASVLITRDVHYKEEVRPAAETINMELSIEGELTIKEVTEVGKRPNSYSFKVTKATLMKGDKPHDGIKEGAVITGVTSEGGSYFEVDGKQPEEEVYHILSTALPDLYPPDMPTEEVFAPPGPVAPGEEWKPEAKEVAEYYSTLIQSKADPAKTTAQFRYKGPAKVEGMEGDTVTATVHSNLTEMPGMPEKATLLSATLDSSMVYTMARDAAVVLPISEKTINDSEYRFSMKTGEKEAEETADFIMKSHSEVRWKVKPVK